MGIVATIGFDIAKSVFQVHGVDGAGGVVIRRKLTRGRAGVRPRLGQGGCSTLSPSPSRAGWVTLDTVGVPDQDGRRDR